MDALLDASGWPRWQPLNTSRNPFPGCRYRRVSLPSTSGHRTACPRPVRCRFTTTCSGAWVCGSGFTRSHARIRCV